MTTTRTSDDQPTPTVDGRTRYLDLSERTAWRGRSVVRVEDDRDDPVVGRVLGWDDEDRCIVAWGDAAFSESAWEQGRVEFADTLTLVRRGQTS